MAKIAIVVFSDTTSMEAMGTSKFMVREFFTRLGQEWRDVLEIQEFPDL